MIAIIAGSLTAILWTISTLGSAQASRRIGAPSTMGGVALVGIVLTVPLLWFGPAPEPGAADHLPLVALVGLTNVIGLLSSYAAVRRGKVSIVAPITSTEGAIAATIAILLGEPAAAALILALALVASGVTLTAWGPEGDDDPGRTGGPLFLGLAITAAAMFGLGLYAVGHASGLVPASWIVAAGRLVGVVFVALPLLVTRRFQMTRAALPFVAIVGVTEVLGFLTVSWGSQDSIAVTAVLSSQFAVITAVISRAMGERIVPRQVVGIVLTGLGVAAVTLLQAG